MKKKFSIVLPIYGNEKNLPITIPYIVDNIPKLFPNYDVEIIMVNDCSPDNSYEIMKEYQKQYPQLIRIASFSRNFGQLIATEYGMRMAKGDVVGVISADLQDPFELFAEMLKWWEEGYELVFGTRASRNERAFFSKITHKLIHKMITKDYPVGGFDFYVMDKNAVKQYLSVNERNGSCQLLMLWFGFKTKSIPYRREERKVGKSGWSFSKKVKYFLDTFITNSYIPMRVMSVFGCLASIIGFLYALYVLISTIINAAMGNWGEAPGWASIVILITIFSGLILFSLGIIGEYLWRIFDYVKGRPRYIVNEIIDDVSNSDSEELLCKTDDTKEQAEV